MLLLWYGLYQKHGLTGGYVSMLSKLLHLCAAKELTQVASKIEMVVFQR